MSDAHFEIVSDKNRKELCAIFGFELPYLPEPMSSDEFGIPLQQEHTHLLNQQIRFLRMFYNQPAETTDFDSLFALPPDHSVALELRFVAKSDKKREVASRRIGIFVFGRVSCANPRQSDRLETGTIYHQTVNYATQFQQHIQQTFPLEYQLRPLTSLDWFRAYPINLEALTDPHCTAEIRKYVETGRGSGFPYPLIWSENTFTQLCKFLWESTSTIIFSVGLQPDQPLSETEKESLRHLAVETVPIAAEGIDSQFVNELAQKYKSAKTRAADYYLRTLNRPFLLRIQVLSDQPVLDGWLQAIGEEISSTQDHVEAGSPVGIWHPYQYCFPDRSNLQVALENFRLIKRAFWGNEYQNRLQYLTGATEANAAFRIPLVTPYGIPGIETLPFNPFAVNWQNVQIGDTENSIRLGIDVKGMEFSFPINSLNRHALIIGATGSGKTTTCQTILTQLMEKGVPFLVIEPVKTEYRSFVGESLRKVSGLGDTLVFTLGDMLSPFKFNPFEIPAGISVGSYISAIKSCFVAAFPMESFLPIVLEKALRQIYKEFGWKNLIERVGDDKSHEFPRLSDLCNLLSNSKFIENLGYSDDFAQDVRAALALRLNNLRDGIVGTILDVKEASPFSWEELLKRPVIFELDNIIDDEEKALIMSFVFTMLAFHRKTLHRAGNDVFSGVRQAPLSHVTLVEEAHRLFSNESTQNNQEVVSTHAKAISLFLDMLAEMRALGEGILIAEQLPTRLVPEIIKYPELKIMHRITADEDRRILEESMNFSERHRKFMATIRQGTAAVYLEGVYTPLLLNINRILAHAENVSEIKLKQYMEAQLQNLAAFHA